MKFPNLAENAMKRANFHPSKKGVEMGITAKIFIGMEYECPRGHRFISGEINFVYSQCAQEMLDEIECPSIDIKEMKMNGKNLSKISLCVKGL